MDTVFHLAAAHGGRGYVDLHGVDCARNLVLDGVVFEACYRAGVTKVVYASSGCVYPNYLQQDLSVERHLSEDMVGPPYDPDNLYGWAKLVGELTLRAYYKELGVKSVCCRYFTVYGERSRENHAITAMIARSFVDQNPFIVWGSGDQVRNWTYVSDIVEGTLLAAEKIDNGIAINLGTTDRISVLEAVRLVLELTGKKHLRVKLESNRPVGPVNRVADNAMAREVLGWYPRVPFAEGLKRTIAWYYSTKNRAAVAKELDRLLTER